MKPPMHWRGPIATAVLSLAWGGTWADDAAIRREDQLKAAYLLNFVKFIEWPAAAAGETLTVCFLGASSIYDALQGSLRGKRIGGHALEARRIAEADGFGGCQVLYAEAAQSANLHLQPQDPRPPVLTISDGKAFASNGGVIELYTDSNRLKFIINMDNARRAGLRVGSALLQLATVIDQEGGK